MSLAQAERRTPVAHLAPAFGIYVHVPFCLSRCPYCDFNTYVGLEDLAPAYLEAVVREAEMWAERDAPPAAGSVFFGGGTPTLVEPRLLVSTLGGIRGALPLAPGAEITVEANPETVDAGLLAVLRDAGVNRVSIGAQSFRGEVLVRLGRAHTAERTRRSVADARAAGFDNISLDLIFGAPGESEEQWRSTLEEAVALEPAHVSCYALTIEPGTAFGAAVASGRMPPPDEDEGAAKYEIALDLLSGAGYEHYEISNWARPGRASRHNLVYWTQGDYAGLGAGAHSHRDGVRSWNRKLPREYLERPRAARAGEESLDAATRAEEWLQLRLRLTEGVGRAEAERRLGRPLGPALEVLCGAGLVEPRADRILLTRRGLLLQQEVCLRLLALDSLEC